MGTQLANWEETLCRDSKCSKAPAKGASGEHNTCQPVEASALIVTMCPVSVPVSCCTVVYTCNAIIMHDAVYARALSVYAHPLAQPPQLTYTKSGITLADSRIPDTGARMLIREVVTGDHPT